MFIFILWYGGGGVGDGGAGGSRSQNPYINPIPAAWLAINSIYIKK